MKITRTLLEQEVQIPLTSNELYLAHKEYVCNAYEADVLEFLDIINVEENKVYSGTITRMAKDFYDIKLKYDYTNDYAMAKAVIPLLDEMEIEHSYNIDYFEDSYFLNCI